MRRAAARSGPEAGAGRVRRAGKKKKGDACATPFLPLSRKTGAHPNPVRIRLLSSATVKRNRYRSRFQPLDLSGATLESWLPAFAFRHVRSTASFRSASPIPKRQLALSPGVAAARRFAACPLLTAIPAPCLRKIFQPSVQRRTDQVRLAHRFVPPVQPAARQAPRIADRAAKHDQDTELLAVVESFFSTIFRVNFWGKDKHFFSSACQIFRKITDKLLAGISTIRSSPRAFFRASGAISRSISRTPQRGSRAFRLASNASFDGAV